jgi:hypothetical protein
MAVSARRREPQTCTNCDRPAPKLAPLVRPTRDGKRITLRVCRFCYLQLVPGTKLRRVPV